MMYNDPLFSSLSRLSELLKNGDISATELISTTVKAASEAQTALNCFAIPLFEEALTSAREADARMAAGEVLGPFHGIPVTIKDGVATEGHLLTYGSLSYRNSVATQDDIVWKRLKKAGAILIGKTTTPEFFHKVVTDSELYGVTRNPWSVRHSPGGSSGGAAVSVAAGLVPVAIGSDGGGSLRCPASCTGIVALKPTRGRVPHVSFPDTFGNYAALGAMSRNVSDLALTLSIIAGSEAQDACSIGVPEFYQNVQKELARMAGTSIAWIPNPGAYGVAPTVVQHGLDALKRLQEVGCRIEFSEGKFFQGAFETYNIIGCSGHASRSITQSPEAQSVWSDSFRAIVINGLSYSAIELQIAQENRTRLFRNVQNMFEQFDLIATPTLMSPPILIGAEGSVLSENYAAWAAALYPFNLTGHPAISVPCGMTEDGLPIGLQFIGRWHDEARLLQIAAILEEIKPWAYLKPSSRFITDERVHS